MKEIFTSNEYTIDEQHKEFINRIAPHTDKVYVTSLGLPVFDTQNNKYKNDGFTSMNGNIKVISNSAEVKVECSNNNLKLKETSWFKQNRKLPNAWKEIN